MSGIPAVSVKKVAQKLANGDDFILLDVREPVELMYANLGKAVAHLPLSQLAEEGVDALPDAIRHYPDSEIVVMCHHGVRSAQVTAWLRQQGWTNVFNMTGGIDAYAREVDPKVGHY